MLEDDDDFGEDERDLYGTLVEEKYYEMGVVNVAFDIEFPDRFRKRKHVLNVPEAE